MELLRRHHHPGNARNLSGDSRCLCRSRSTSHVAMLRGDDRPASARASGAGLRAESLAVHIQAVLQGAFIMAKARQDREGRASTASITCIAMSNCCSAVRPVVARQQNHNAEGAAMHRIVSQEQWIAERKRLMAGGKGIHAPARRAGRKTPRPALGQGRQGLRVRFAARPRDVRGSVPRPLAALRCNMSCRDPGQPLQCVGCALGIDHSRACCRISKITTSPAWPCARDACRSSTALRERMGWRMPFYSSFGSDFNYDFGVSFKPEDMAAGPRRSTTTDTAIRASKTFRATTCSSGRSRRKSSTRIRTTHAVARTSSASTASSK